MIAEIDITQSQPRLLRSYEWGLDVSETPEGAGGVGGLVVEWCYRVSGGTTSLEGYAPCYDGNGNVMALVSLSLGEAVGQYEYGAFGETISVEGDWAVQGNPVRFSTKYGDAETGLVYDTHRYYEAATGRWLSGDPIEEDSVINLYGMVGNDPVNKWDYLGLASSAYDAIATVRRRVGNPFGTYGAITIKAVAKVVSDFTALTIELPYGRYNAGGTSGEANFPVRSSATGYLRRRPNLASSKSVSADSSVPAQVLGSWSGGGGSVDNAEVALNSSFWQGQGEVYIHAGQYPTHSTFCVLVGSSYIQGKHLLPDFPSMSNWPASRNAAPGTLITAMAAVAQRHGNVNPEQFVWDEFGREDALQTQYRMNLWIAELEERLCKRGASKKHENEPIMMIRVNIDDSGMNYSSQLSVYP